MCKLLYKSTSSVYGERTPTSSHHVYVVYTLLTVHIKCIWSTNIYKFTSSVYGVNFYTSPHQVYMVKRTPTSSHHVYVVYTLLTVHIKCIWCTNFYKFTSCTCGVHTSNSSH